MGLFGKSNKQRRNSDDDNDNTQYWTPRGAIPARIVEAQVRQAGNLQMKRESDGYPHLYRNAGREGALFDGYERRHDEHRQFSEVPIATRMNFDKPSASVKKVQGRETVHYGDRARVARSELNDPGPYRAIVPIDERTGRTYGVAGVVYHPEGRPNAFHRAPVVPMDRQGRQALHRYEDDGARGYRVDTWPPRDEDGDDLGSYEARHKQVRKSKSKWGVK